MSPDNGRPGVFHQAAERWDDLITRRITVGLEQRLIVLSHGLRYLQLHLRWFHLILGDGLRIRLAYDMQHHIII